MLKKELQNLLNRNYYLDDGILYLDKNSKGYWSNLDKEENEELINLLK
ncbi:MAG TPA: hypothetical protein PLJ38_10485 [bacterium]|nr:hypothetical protein [bacterium]